MMLSNNCHVMTINYHHVMLTSPNLRVIILTMMMMRMLMLTPRLIMPVGCMMAVMTMTSMLRDNADVDGEADTG